MKEFFHNPFSIIHFIRKYFFLVSCVMCLVSFSAYAQDITFQAEVSSTQVALGNYFRLTLTATDAQGIQPPQLPDIDGVKVQFIGPSTRVSIVNGKHSSSYAFVYNLYPTRTGEVTIPSVSVSINGKEYSTQPITVTISASAAASSSNQTGGDSQSIEEVLGQHIFVTLDTPEKEAYVNQAMPIFIRLYIGGISVRNIEPPQLDHAGFLMDEFKEHRQYEQILNGMRYSVVEFETVVYPLRSGEAVLGPAREKAEIVFKNPEASRRSGSFGFFDDDFFDGFFNAYTARELTITSKPLTLTVRELPEQGKPENFNGAVGKFTFNMNISPEKVKVGDPVTVRMKVAGLGSLKTFELDGYETNKDFKVYEPSVKEEAGVKILEQVLIPQAEGRIAVPEKEFVFFDSDREQYRTISWGPVYLQVDPVEHEEGLKVVGFSGGQSGGSSGRREILGKDIGFIKNRLGSVYPVGANSFHLIFFGGSLTIVLLGWIGGAAFFHFTYRLKTDERFARRLQAPRYARTGLKNARAFIENNNCKEFYDELFKTLQKYFAHKFHIPPGAVNAPEVIAKLDASKENEAVVSNVKYIFEQCEMARYARVASAGFDRSKMMQDYDKAREIIDWVERKF